MSENIILNIQDIEISSNKLDENTETNISTSAISIIVDAELESMFDLGKKKKKHKEKDKNKKKVIDYNTINSTINSTSAYSSASALALANEETIVPNYTYLELLNYLYSKLGNLENNTTNKFIIPQPIIQKITIKKVIWSNFNDICISLNRKNEEIFQFVLSELNTEGFINENKQMIIKGKYFSKNIETILKKYMSIYVQCNMCRSYKTVINRDTVSRLNILLCSDCKSSRTITSIKKINKNN